MVGALKRLKGTIFHPQWLTDRFHTRSRKCINKINIGTILDIGSGNSDNAKHIFSGATLFRLDYPDTSRRYETRPDIYGDACRLPIATGSVDVIFLFEVLEHVSDDVAAVEEISRALRPKGRLYISVPFIYPIHDAPQDFRRFTIYGIRNLLENHRLNVVQERFHGNSVVTSLQLINLFFMEITRDIYLKNKALGLLLGSLFYPFCIGINVVSWPLGYIKNINSSCFGYFLIAERT